MKKASRRPEVESLETIRLLSGFLPSIRPPIASLGRQVGSSESIAASRSEVGRAVTTTFTVTRPSLPSGLAHATGLASASTARLGVGSVNTSIASTGSRTLAISTASTQVAASAAAVRPEITFKVEAAAKGIKLS